MDTSSRFWCYDFMRVHGFHGFYVFSFRVQMWLWRLWRLWRLRWLRWLWCVQAFRWNRRRAKEMPLQQFHLRPRVDDLCLRTCHPVPTTSIASDRRGTVGVCGHWEHGRNVKRYDMKGRLTGWVWPGLWTPGSKLERIPHHCGGELVDWQFLQCSFCNFHQDRIKSNIFQCYSGFPKSLQIWHNSYSTHFHTVLSGRCQGDP